MQIDQQLQPRDLLPAVQRAFELGAAKARGLDRTWNPANGAPVFTAAGRYTARGWTEWTQGFQYGGLILAGEGLADARLIEQGRRRTRAHMLPHITHMGVHDHGFNNLSTYGNLLRLQAAGAVRLPTDEVWAYRQLLAVSGAVQAARWAATADGGGYVYSFNGPHSLFIDTLRSLRVLAVAHGLGHELRGENDGRVNLLGRALQHALTTDRHLVFHGESGHGYDVRGRTAHEGLFK